MTSSAHDQGCSSIAATATVRLELRGTPAQQRALFDALEAYLLDFELHGDE